MTDNQILFDSNVWIGYFLQSNETIALLVESAESKIFTSILSFHEVAKILDRKERSPAFIREAMRYMRENSSIVELKEGIAVDAINWCAKNKLSAVDGMIYQSAIVSSAILLTADSDFDGLPKVHKINL